MMQPELTPNPWIAAFSIVFNLFAAFWAYRAFRPKLRDQPVAQPSERGEGSAYARRRKVLLPYLLAWSVSVLFVSVLGGPAFAQELPSYMFMWVFLFESMPVRLLLFGGTMLLHVAAVAGAVRHLIGWLNGGPRSLGEASPPQLRGAPAE